jgi:hypothetical protein
MKIQPNIEEQEFDYLLQDIKQIKEFEIERWKEKHIRTEEELFLDVFNSRQYEEKESNKA